MTKTTAVIAVILLVAARVLMRISLDMAWQDMTIAVMGVGYSFLSLALCVFFFSINDDIARSLGVEAFVDVIAAGCTTVFSIFTVMGIPIPPRDPS